MDNREILNEYLMKKDRYRCLADRLVELQKAACAPAIPTLSDMPKAHCNLGLDDKVARMELIENELTGLQTEINDMTKRVCNAILNMVNTRAQQIFTYKYLDCLTNKEIAYKVGYSEAGIRGVLYRNIPLLNLDS